MAQGGMLRRLAWRLSPGAFTAWALGVLRKEAPDLAPRRETDDTIAVGGADGVQLGLQSLRAIALQGDLSEVDLRQELVDRARRLASAPQRPATWDEARALLRPQLMPEEYLEQAPAPLLHRPFHSGVLAGVVLDLPRSYSYVRAEDCAAWDVAPEAIWRQAIDNLDAASAGMEAHVAEGPDRWIAIAMCDGYDAARLLVPGVRGFLADRLGEPFYAGTPNRDFLIAWAADCTPRFWEFVSGKLQKDHGEQPYPLTPASSRATREWVRIGDRAG